MVSLTRGARYDKVMAALGGKGILVKDPTELLEALEQSQSIQDLHWLRY